MNRAVKPPKSVFSLVVFCATSALVAALALVVLFAGVTVAVAVARELRSSEANSGSPVNEVLAVPPAQSGLSAPNTIIFAGVVTDDNCGPRHDMGSGKSPSECTRLCVREGGKYLIISGDKKYLLEGEADELATLAGEKATVVGSLTGNTIRISSISREK
jgi:hypothetical protein